MDAQTVITNDHHWQRMKDLAQSDKENRIDMTQTPVRSRLLLSPHSSASKNNEIAVPDDIFRPPVGTRYSPERAVQTLAQVPKKLPMGIH